MEKSENSLLMFEANIVSNTIKVIDTKDTSNDIMFFLSDPLDNQIILWENTFKYHILGEDGSHEDRSYFLKPDNMERIKKVIQAPQLIISDKINNNRLNYIGLSLIQFETKRCMKRIDIITEPSKKKENTFEICTIMVKSSASIAISEGRKVIYDAHDQGL
mgnify:FL=1